MPCVQLILLCQLQSEQVRGFCVHGHVYLSSTSKCYTHLCHLSFSASPIFQHACFLICMSDIDTCCPFIAGAKTEDWDGLKWFLFLQWRQWCLQNVVVELEACKGDWNVSIESLQSKYHRGTWVNINNSNTLRVLSYSLLEKLLPRFEQL